MRAVRVRELERKLSEYLRLVADGETVLVTAHGQVIAQLAPPPTIAPPSLTEDEALRRLAAAGKVRLPLRAHGFGASPVTGIPPGLDVAHLLSQVRGNRGD